ncbi:hypothetical protein ACFST9_15320 [Hymenobacter monticola]|uniref:Proteophosphoglycan ppg4 n=1 Tax=Hymenobacter monticola TaxID=1705399 RepID=A0ABY4B4S7_9BACT|nr:hypothetical protein [Hymenobacter monticola]UOE32716.1 hypothetical protein MTP16_16455 [Hymenobacter monticola]
MIKPLLSTFLVAGLLGPAAQAQTTPAGAPTTGNHTAGTTTNPVDPTSKVGQKVSGTMGRNSSSHNAPDRPTTSGNHTAGTTANPVDPTSNSADATRSNGMNNRQTRKTKSRTSN